ncbi:hypothetical protein DACRYDRAFT_117363 [Dacryopinax primogenitus]|uniref:Uncharacterized protein n=1 Tax=Dacryopinax primogenitus (strain DJM 731) TaxID=1858805 RepID=M5G3B1_DACPD|nr:uncharacterized protein DACRYDRAFT_117363 [Dacryopinax primogenitus]EJU00367.1 hypothetical protein DACRYDRAFT_117363 [Dacryopinax primogenitus]
MHDHDEAVVTADASEGSVASLNDNDASTYGTLPSDDLPDEDTLAELVEQAVSLSGDTTMVETTSHDVTHGAWTRSTLEHHLKHCGSEGTIRLHLNLTVLTESMNMRDAMFDQLRDLIDYWHHVRALRMNIDDWAIGPLETSNYINAELPLRSLSVQDLLRHSERIVVRVVDAVQLHTIKLARASIQLVTVESKPVNLAGLEKVALMDAELFCISAEAHGKHAEAPRKIMSPIERTRFSLACVSSVQHLVLQKSNIVEGMQAVEFLRLQSLKINDRPLQILYLVRALNMPYLQKCFLLFPNCISF